MTKITNLEQTRIVIGEGVNLNYGCGRFKLQGFVNIDISPIYNPDQCIDCISHMEKQKSNSVDNIYAGHVLEHLPYPDLHKFYKEVKRILKPTGQFIMTVPNIENAIKMYNNRELNPGQLDLIAFGDRQSVHEYHQTVWCERRIREHAIQYGFEILSMPEVHQYQVVPVAWQTTAIMKKV